MKKRVAAIVLLALLLSLAACGKEGQPSPNQSAPRSEGQSSAGASSGQEGPDAAPGVPVESLSTSADFNHDGVAESFQVLSFCDGAYFEAQIRAEDGTLLWTADAGMAHTAWLSLFLCQLDGENYLLRYAPTMFQGICNYQYELFYLDSSGGELMVDSNCVDFDLNFGSPSGHAFPTEEIAAFMEQINGHLAQSTVLFNTNEDLAPALESSPPLKDTLWWLDAEEGFTYDKAADLKAVLSAYQEYQESKVPSPGA